MNDPNKKIAWQSLKPLFTKHDYIDQQLDIEDISLLSRLIKTAPLTIKNLKGLKISEQLKLVKTLFDKFKNNPILGLFLLENKKVILEDIKNQKMDEKNVMLLELSVRKSFQKFSEFQNYKRIQKILYDKDIKDSEKSNIHFNDEIIWT